MEMGKPVLDPQVLLSLILANADRVGMGADDRDALQNSGFDTRTPLWYYILAEAELLEGGKRLGSVGATIVAEVLIGLVRKSPDSIFDQGGDWNRAQLSGKLEMDITGDFNLSDLLKLAGVLS